MGKEKLDSNEINSIIHQVNEIELSAEDEDKARILGMILLMEDKLASLKEQLIGEVSI